MVLNLLSRYWSDSSKKSEKSKMYQQFSNVFRGIANALHILAACAEDDRRPLSNQDILMALCLEDHVPRPYSPVSAVERAVGTSVVPGMRYPLNEGQVEQIREALTRKISMIQGPPGR